MVLRPLRLAFCRYRRPFRTPLQTAHGAWQQREGILLRLIDAQGRVGLGEIAPLPWFGTEDMAAALTLCEHLKGDFWPEEIATIPATLPACRFGFESTYTSLSEAVRGYAPPSPEQICGLLPTGSWALTHWVNLWRGGHRTFKWKIGVADPETELQDFATLLAVLPATARLRLDANGSLTLAEAEAWLAVCDRIALSPTSAQIEFLEQPLSPEQDTALWHLSQRYRTPLALDESVATLAQLEDWLRRGWPGIVVVKAAIAGSPQQLRQICQRYPVDAVFSSVFETPVGRQAVLSLVQQIQTDFPHFSRRALGFGTQSWFDDDWDRFKPEDLWQHLTHQPPLSTAAGDTPG